VKEEKGTRSKEAFLPLEFDYGQVFESDWLDVYAIWTGAW